MFGWLLNRPLRIATKTKNKKFVEEQQCEYYNRKFMIPVLIGF